MRSLAQFLSRGQNVIGLALVLAFVGVAALAPVIAPWDRLSSMPDFHVVGRGVDRTPHPPSELAPFGTLPGQWDVFYTVVWGTRSALRFGLAVTLCTGAIGTLIGLITGYLGGWPQKLIMPVVDAFLAFPPIAGLALIRFTLLSRDPNVPLSALRSWFVESGGDPLMITLILFSWVPYARIMNATTYRLKEMDYVHAARALGAGSLRTIFRHLLPNAISPAIVLAARDVGGMVVLAAAFTFIGFGGASSWGAMLAMGRDWIIGIGGNPFGFWWTYVPATLALLLFGVGWNLLGDGLNAMLTTRQESFPGPGRRRGGRHLPLGLTATALTLGLILGVVWSWLQNPATPVDLNVSQLEARYRADYLRLTIDSLSQSLDVDLAMQRYQRLGVNASEDLRDLRNGPGHLSREQIDSFRGIVDVLKPLYPLQPSTARQAGTSVPLANTLMAGGLISVLLVGRTLIRRRRRPALR